MTHSLESYFEDYSFNHQTMGNLLTHFIGIPLIVISLFGLLDRVLVGPVIYSGISITLSMLLFAISNFFYFRLDKKLGFAMLLATSGGYILGMKLSILMNTVFFVLGWVFQLWGHKTFEKNKPAFMKNFTHVFIGPAYIVNKIFKITSSNVRHE